MDGSGPAGSAPPDPEPQSGQKSEQTSGHARPDAEPRAATPEHGADAAALAADWIDLWQSELAGLITDPEWVEGQLRLVTIWAGMAQAASSAMPGATRHDRGAGWPGQAAPPGPTPDRAASDALRVALERVADRLDALERRLARLESAGGQSSGGEPPGGDAGGGGRPAPRSPRKPARGKRPKGS